MFFIDKWVTICIIKFEDRPFHFVMAMAQIKGGSKWHFWKRFLNSDFRNGISNYQLVTLQTTEIQQFKFECFSMKTLEFRQDDVIIYDVSEDFRILLGIWNRLVKGYLCAKFSCYRTIVICNTCIFHICSFYFSYSRQGFQQMTSLSMTLTLWVLFCLSLLVYQVLL